MWYEIPTASELEIFNSGNLTSFIHSVFLPSSPAVLELWRCSTLGYKEVYLICDLCCVSLPVVAHKISLDLSQIIVLFKLPVSSGKIPVYEEDFECWD